ncbi:MAG: class I SAM-dependent methyltransferase [Coriobacteriales bacterium]|jgi:16S rRNA (guanine527-N7)-methyltransferase|nr:class I SAM-dependent methyltransferase [Coriobacteriales bacterium]
MLTPFGQLSDNSPLDSVSCHQRQVLFDHLQCVLSNSDKINLTSIKSSKAGEVLHIEDSLRVLPEVLKAPEGSLIDIGSGTGYPGIPLAVCTGKKTLLVESIAKKGAILDRFVASNGLGGLIEIVSERSETVALERPEQFSVATVRAVGQLPTVVELAAPLLMNKGLLVALKGRPTDVEIARGVQAGNLVGLSLVSSRRYKLSNGSCRSVYLFRKDGEPVVSLPRRPGMANKRPLA